MDLNTITVADFKALFPRDFPYLPVWSSSELYNIGNEVYYPTTKLFYKSLINGNTNIIPGSDGTKWELFADSIDNYVQDSDITKAFAEAQANLNQALFGSDAIITLAYLYLTAHYLVNDLRAALQGIQASSGFPVSSRKVGSVSESYEVPKAYLEDPILLFYTTSAYGLKYLSIALPKITGNVHVVAGWTLP